MMYLMKINGPIWAHIGHVVYEESPGLPCEDFLKVLYEYDLRSS